METEFSEKITTNNKTIGKIHINNLLKYIIEIPNLQRLKCDIKITEIVEYQTKYYKNNGHFNFLGVINIHYDLSTNKYYLVDGQHRYNSLLKLKHNDYNNIEVLIELIKVNNIDSLKENYKIINNNTPLPEFPDNIEEKQEEIIKETALYFFEKYKDIWSTTSAGRKPRIPHISKNYFQESLGFLINELNITSSQCLIKYIEDYNNILSKRTLENLPTIHSKTPDKIIDKCKQSKLYLGLYSYDTNIGYKWTNEILYSINGNKKKIKREKTKQKIPKSIKNNSWNKYIGLLKGTSVCICCNIKTIDSKQFIGGHIISEKNGGKVTIDNIIPICSGCNNSMGSTNMDIWIQSYYPENYNSFQLFTKTNIAI